MTTIEDGYMLWPDGNDIEGSAPVEINLEIDSNSSVAAFSIYPRVIRALQDEFDFEDVEEVDVDVG